MKDIIKEYNFTLKSLVPAFILMTIGIGSTCLSTDFDNNTKKIVALIIIVSLVVSYLIYLSIVLCLYYKLPKNKKNKMGVLFYINTHGNEDDYKAITQKFCERFNELSTSIQTNNLVPIILSQKKVSVIKNVHERKTQFDLLQKTDCLFGVFMKSTDEGKNCDEYQLQMNAMIVHPELSKELKSTLSNNFNYIFRDLYISSLSRNNDLKNLQSLSTQLYYICQLIYAVANEYSRHFIAAIQLCNEILNNIKHDTSKFYKHLSKIIMCEICSCAICITSNQYNNFILGKGYNLNIVHDALSLMNEPQHTINIPIYTINYHLAKAVYKLLDNNLIEAQGEINILEKSFPDKKPNVKPWRYSEAFLLACENNPKKFWKVEQKYRQLKNNLTQEPSEMFNFINAYYSDHQEILGVKIAMILIIKYKELPCDLLPITFIDEVIEELNALNCHDFAQHMEDIKQEFMTSAK